MTHDQQINSCKNPAAYTAGKHTHDVLRGCVVVIPAATPVHSMRSGKWHPSRLKRTVKIFDQSLYDDWVVTTWPGGSGYWRRAVSYKGQYVDRFPS